MSAARRAPIGVAARLERASVIVMALGVALMLQPWWSGGLRVGFFVTAFGTLAQIVTSHLPERRA
jgi:hypothetical protein